MTTRLTTPMSWRLTDEVCDLCLDGINQVVNVKISTHVGMTVQYSSDREIEDIAQLIRGGLFEPWRGF